MLETRITCRLFCSRKVNDSGFRAQGSGLRAQGSGNGTRDTGYRGVEEGLHLCNKIFDLSSFHRLCQSARSTPSATVFSPAG